MGTQAPTILTIDGQRFTLVAVWKESLDGNKTFEGYMLYPYDKNAPIAPKPNKDSKLIDGGSDVSKSR